MRIVRIARGIKHSVFMTGVNNPMYGKTQTEETKTKMRAWWTPEKRDEKSISISGENHPSFGKSLSKKTKTKIGASNTGKIRTEETKVKMSKSAIENWKDPEKRDEQRARMTGPNNPSWRDGTSFEPYGVEFNNELKTQIRDRDNHTCQECHQTEEQLGHALDVHHIDYDKKNNSPDNLISLCKSCHAQTNYGREDWTEYFSKIMEN